MHLRSHIHINLRDSAFFGCTNRDKDGLSKKKTRRGILFDRLIVKYLNASHYAYLNLQLSSTFPKLIPHCKLFHLIWRALC